MRPGKVLAAFGVVVVIAATSRYLLVRSRSRLPAPDSPLYEETTRSFYRGLAQLQVGLLDDAKREFTKTTELVSSEPAGWANLGLAHLRLGEFDAAAAPIERAVRLAPRASDVVFLQGRLGRPGANSMKGSPTIAAPSSSMPAICVQICAG
jgi:tetratricopeptide (TPR) repeat protein